MFQLLLLCPGNAARSILAEAIFNRDGAGRVRAWSAGTNPVGLVHPAALRCLAAKGLETKGLRSKGRAEFTAAGAPRLDVVIALCPTVSAEVGPAWPGNPLAAEWAVPDPMQAPPDQIDLAFLVAYHRLSARINALLALPFETMERHRLAAELARIGAA